MTGNPAVLPGERCLTRHWDLSGRSRCWVWCAGGGGQVRALGLSRAEAVALVQRIMEADYASEDEVNDWLDTLDRALACPSGHVSDLVFWPSEGELSAEEVVDQALAYRPIAL